MDVAEFINWDPAVRGLNPVSGGRKHWTGGRWWHLLSLVLSPGESAYFGTLLYGGVPVVVVQSGYALEDREQFRAEYPSYVEPARPCFLCGRAVKGEKGKAIHLSVRGEIVPIDVELDPSEDQGWFDIGPECAKKLPKGYVA